MPAPCLPGCKRATAREVASNVCHSRNGGLLLPAGAGCCLEHLTPDRRGASMSTPGGSSETLTHEEIWAIYQDARHYAEELNEKRKDLELSLSVMNKRPDIDWNPAEYERQQRQ